MDLEFRHFAILAGQEDHVESYSHASNNLLSVDKNCIAKIEVDVGGKNRAMVAISETPFIRDSSRLEYQQTQNWITSCAKQVELPTNFCGGLLIVRLCRRLVPLNRQTNEWVDAVHRLAAAYDFAFLALGHADDEADMTSSRNGKPTRWTTHPETRAVDAINLLLAGVTDAQKTLAEWPIKDPPWAPRPELVLQELLAALREASFPILFDRAGLGHSSDENSKASIGFLKIDARSLQRLELFSRHRAHSYFLRATRIAIFSSGYTSINSDLGSQLDKLFTLLGAIGSASDDLQDTFVDISSGVHSAVSIMAHLCVAEDHKLRPDFRRSLPSNLVELQRKRLEEIWNPAKSGLNERDVLSLMDEIELKRAMRMHYQGDCIEFANAMYVAVSNFGLSVDLISEIVQFVCKDDDFSIPSTYIKILESITDAQAIAFANGEIGKYISGYFVERFWPTLSRPDHVAL